MRALVLGGSAFIGRQLVDTLLHRGHSVTVLNRGLTPNDLPDDVERAIEALLQPELPMPAEHVPSVRDGGAYAAHLTEVSGRLDGLRVGQPLERRDV